MRPANAKGQKAGFPASQTSWLHAGARLSSSLNEAGYRRHPTHPIRAPGEFATVVLLRSVACCRDKTSTSLDYVYARRLPPDLCSATPTTLEKLYVSASQHQDRAKELQKDNFGSRPSDGTSPVVPSSDCHKLSRLPPWSRRLRPTSLPVCLGYSGIRTGWMPQAARSSSNNTEETS